jgi:hypothetical protein
MGVRRVKGIVERITATAMSRVKNFFMIKLLTKLNFVGSERDADGRSDEGR